MIRKLLAVFFFISIQTSQAQDAVLVLKTAVERMGATDLKSIHYSGKGYDFALGQNANPYMPFPRYEVKSYNRWVDYSTGDSREVKVRTQWEDPIRGGSEQPLPERKETLYIKADKAMIDRGGAPGPTPAPADVAPFLPVWLTPHGFILKAQKQVARTRSGMHDGNAVTIVTFELNGLVIDGYIDAEGFLRKVVTAVPYAHYGDMNIEILYLEYRDFDGIQFPAHIVEKQTGFPVLDVRIDSVTANAPVIVELPAGRGTPPSLPEDGKLPVQQVEKGIWMISGLSHNSVAIEFDDFVAVVEAPLSDERSREVIARVNEILPGKPIRYLVNTHHHYDHAGGIWAYAMHGATIVTQEQNVAFYRGLLESPRRLAPAVHLPESGRDKLFRSFTYYDELTDGVRHMELHLVQGDLHSDGMVMVYLPTERILIQADLYSPGLDANSASAPPHPFAVNLYENIRRLRLDVNKVIPIHGSVVPYRAMLAHLKVK